jgi:glycerol-3-phosphate dehydrogenase
MLFLNSKAAIASAPEVASLMAKELGKGEEWEHAQVSEFKTLAKHFTLEGVVS